MMKVGAEIEKERLQYSTETLKPYKASSFDFSHSVGASIIL
jgi:hypothetical protein